MWMNSYLLETLIRERIADAQHRAARDHLLRGNRPRRRAWALRDALMTRLIGRTWHVLRERRV
jgi:hypothetical protein